MNLEAMDNVQGTLNVSEAELGWLARIIDAEVSIILFLDVRKVDHQGFGRAEIYRTECFIEFQKRPFDSIMKTRNYNFSVQTVEGGTHTRKELIHSLQRFAKKVGTNTFTQKQYDAWNKRLLCSAQIRVRFGGWSIAMEKAGLQPSWRPTRNLTEMIEIYRDCWQENDDVPTDKTLTSHLRKIDSPYTANLYKKYFGGLRRLKKRIIDFHSGKISESALVERYDLGSIQNNMIVYSLSSTRDGCERYVGDTNDTEERLKQHIRAAKKEHNELAKWILQEIKNGFEIKITVLQKKGVVRDIDEKRWVHKLRADGAKLFNKR